MRVVTLYSGGRLLREWTVDSEPGRQRDGELWFHAASDPECKRLIRISGTYVIEDIKDKYGNREETKK